MHLQSTLDLANAIRGCAMSMMNSALYIRKELPNVTMSDELRAETEEVCDSLIATKHDLLNQLADAGDSLDAGNRQEALRRLAKGLAWAREDLGRMHNLVTRLRDAAGASDDYSACMLVQGAAIDTMMSYGIANAFLRSERSRAARGWG